MQNTKLLAVALALTGLGFLGAGTAFADEPVTPAPATTSHTTVLADDDWYDDDWDDRWDD